MEGYCRYEGDLLEHLEYITSPEQCQLACSKLGICEYFVYDYDKDDCELLNAPLRKCDILRGPPEPKYETCFNTTSTTTSPSTKTTTESSTENTSFETTRQSTTQPSLKLAVMLIGGYGNDGLMSDVEAVDPYDSDSNCLKPHDFPDARYGLIAEFFDGTPIVCSGYGTGGDQKDCFTYKNEKWEMSPTNLTIARRYATSVVINKNTMWVSGGDKESSKSSSETLHVGGTFHLTTELPNSMEQHCSSRINDTHFFVAGNYYGAQTDAYIVNIDPDTVDQYHYKRLPNMRHQRYGAACMTMRDSTDGDVKLLVAGGYRFDSFTTTEIYSLQTHKWKDGPLLPRGFFYGSYVQYPDEKDFVMMGGKDDSGVIYNTFMRYNKGSDQFELMPGSLESGRWSFGATLVLTTDSC